MILLVSSSSYGATYSYYFSTSGGGSTCSEVSPCKYVSSDEYGYSSGTTAQDKFDAHSSPDVVNLYFKRGDTWYFDTAEVAQKYVFALWVSTDAPAVNIDAYGEGDKPVFDGMVSDFSAVPEHNETTGPFMWNNMLLIASDNSTIKNIKITNIYGSGISFGNTTSYGDNLTIEGCEISYFGFFGMQASNPYGTRNTTITKNIIHHGGNLYMNDKTPGSDWAYGISVAPVWGNKRAALGNTISYNVVYDLAGEGIHGNGATVEYNIVGDTGSVGIYINPFAQDGQDHIIRFNLVMMSDWATSEMYAVSGVSPDGIYIADEGLGGGGDNSGATLQVYGNTVINRVTGIVFNDFDDLSAWGEIRIFNNTLIDNNTNLVLQDWQVVAAGKGFIYNNSSILYDRIGGTHAANWGGIGTLTNYWTISHNHFWTTGGSPTVGSDFQSNYVTTDPKIYGEEKGSPINWDGLPGGNPCSNGLTFADTRGDVSGALKGAGINTGFDATLLSDGDFTSLPDTQDFTTGEQVTDSYDIGSVLIGAGASATGTMYTGLGGSNVSEDQIVSGLDDNSDPLTIVATVYDTTWEADVCTTHLAAMRNGFVSNGSETHGWNNDVQDTLTCNRDSDTQTTWTVPATATYVITANEIITLTIPAAAVALGEAIEVSQTITVSNVSPAASGRVGNYDANGLIGTYDTNGHIVN